MIALGHVTHLRYGNSAAWSSAPLFEAARVVLFTTALMHMPLAELSTIVLVSPLIITALAVIFFGEVVGWRRWTAIAVGFVGTLFVVKPTPASFDGWALLGILRASSASRDLLTRQLRTAHSDASSSRSRPPSIVMLAGALLGCSRNWRPLTLRDLGLLALAAFCLGSANYLIVIAFRGADISAVAPFRYTMLIWAGIVGYLVFGEVPDRWSFVGSLLIAGSGIYALHREQVRRRTIARRRAARRARRITAAAPVRHRQCVAGAASPAWRKTHRQSGETSD